MIEKLIISFVGAIAMGLLYNAKPQRLFFIGVTGVLGYSIFLMGFQFSQNVILSTLLSAYFIGFTSEIFARVFKVPAIIFSIPAIICLVPGYSTYATARLVIDQQMVDALIKGVETMSVAGSIAVGIMLGTTVFNLYGNVKSIIHTKNVMHKVRRARVRRM
jgi:uncharacterized membrane protein YjjB (DUF3815 family)